MRAKCWLCNSPSPPRREIDRIPGVNYRCQGSRLCLAFATGHMPTLFPPRMLDPFTHLRAAPSQLIDNLPWWVEAPCHQLLSHWKSIKNNTHLHPWARGPFVVPVWQWRVLVFFRKMPRNSGEKKYEGWMGRNHKQIWNGKKCHLSGRVPCTDGEAVMSVGIKTPMYSTKLKKCITSHYLNISAWNFCHHVSVLTKRITPLILMLFNWAAFPCNIVVYFLSLLQQMSQLQPFRTSIQSNLAFICWRWAMCVSVICSPSFVCVSKYALTFRKMA